METSYGYDLALLSGALVEVTMKGDVIDRLSVLFRITRQKRGKGHSRMGDLTPETISVSIRGLLLPLVLVPKVPVGIDWDLRDSYWGNRKHSGLKAFLAGYVHSFFHFRSLEPSFLTPEYIRAFYDLDPKASKELVHLKFLRSERMSPSAKKTWDRMNEDERDAVLLGVVAHHQSKAKRS